MEDDLDLKSFRKRLYEQKCAYYSIRFQMKQRGPTTAPNVKEVHKKFQGSLGQMLRAYKEQRQLPSKLREELLKVDRMTRTGQLNQMQMKKLMSTLQSLNEPDEEEKQLLGEPKSALAQQIRFNLLEK